jgi:hypothetical protein
MKCLHCGMIVLLLAVLRWRRTKAPCRRACGPRLLVKSTFLEFSSTLNAVRFFSAGAGLTQNLGVARVRLGFRIALFPSRRKALR